MKLHSDNIDIKRSGIAGETNFSIKLSSKMYSILTDGLYSDKIGSVVREVCSNAYDAHIAANKRDVPFRVFLPTTLEPHFIVEDFGTGLPNEKLIELYSTLGLSTKDSSNDMIGAFGLGSKSPLAVTSSFTIENVYDGVVHYYMCFKDEQGLPSILQTGSAETDRENGIKVSIPAGGNQYSEYWWAMKRQLIMMNPKPIIANANASEFPEMNVLLSNDIGFILTNGNDFGLRRGVYAKMGIVLYPINDGGVTYAQSQMLSKMGYDNVLIINFDIGDLEPLPSREGLSFDDETRKIVSDRVTKFFDTYKADALKKLSAFEGNLVELYNETIKTSRSLGFVIEGEDLDRTPKVSFKNKYLPERDVTVVHEKWISDANHPSGGEYKNVDVVVKKCVYSTTERYSKTWNDWKKDRYHRGYGMNEFTMSRVCEIHDENVIFVLYDETKLRQRRLIALTAYVEENFPKCNEIIFFKDDRCQDAKDGDATELIDAFDAIVPGMSKVIIKYSDITPVEKEVVARNQRQYEETEFRGVEIFVDSYKTEDTDEDGSPVYISRSRVTYDTKVEEFIPVEEMTYINLYRGNVQRDGKDFNMSIESIYRLSRAYTIPVVFIHKVSEKRLKYFQENGARDFFDVIVEKFKDNLTQENKDVIDAHRIENIIADSHRWGRYNTYLDLLKGIGDTAPSIMVDLVSICVNERHNSLEESLDILWKVKFSHGDFVDFFRKAFEDDAWVNDQSGYDSHQYVTEFKRRLENFEDNYSFMKLIPSNFYRSNNYQNSSSVQYRSFLNCIKIFMLVSEDDDVKPNPFFEPKFNIFDVEDVVETETIEGNEE